MSFIFARLQHDHPTVDVGNVKNMDKRYWCQSVARLAKIINITSSLTIPTPKLHAVPAVQCGAINGVRAKIGPVEIATSRVYHQARGILAIGNLRCFFPLTATYIGFSDAL